MVRMISMRSSRSRGTPCGDSTSAVPEGDHGSRNGESGGAVSRCVGQILVVNHTFNPTPPTITQ